MLTEKLYLNESLLLDFEAVVLAVSSFDGRPSLILDRSAFYGEAGGQLGDRGTITADGDLVVVDCQYDQDDRLHHLFEPGTQLPSVGTAVTGQVAFDPRRDMMSQHTGQHLLSAAFAQMLDAETVSSRLGSKLATLDLAIPELSDAQLDSVMAKVNQLVLENRPMRIHYPNEVELTAMALRRMPKVQKDIRVIEIEGYDFTPCGGTHCRATGEIGPVYALSRERYKGQVRLNFICGTRVMERLQDLDANARWLGDTLGSGAAGVNESVIKLQKDLKETQQRLASTRSTLLRTRCSAILAEHPESVSGRTTILGVYSGESLDDLRTLGSMLAQRPDVLSVLAGREGEDGDWSLVVDAGAATGFDAGSWFRDKVKPLGGRGGGKAQHAEGRLPGAVDPNSLVLD